MDQLDTFIRGLFRGLLMGTSVAITIIAVVSAGLLAASGQWVFVPVMLLIAPLGIWSFFSWLYHD